MRLSGQIFQSGVRTVRSVQREAREQSYLYLSLPQEYHCDCSFIPQENHSKMYTRTLRKLNSRFALEPGTDPKLFHGFMLRGKHSFLMDQADEMRDMLLTVMKRHANRLSLERREVRESCRAIQWTELSLKGTNEKQVKEYRLCADATGLPSQVTETHIKIHVENGTNQGQVVKFLEFAQSVIRDSSSQSRLDVTLLCRTQYSETTAMIVGLSKCLELEFPDRIRVRRVYYSDQEDLKTSLSFPNTNMIFESKGKDVWSACHTEQRILFQSLNS